MVGSRVRGRRFESPWMQIFFLSILHFPRISISCVEVKMKTEEKITKTFGYFEDNGVETLRILLRVNVIF